MYVKGWIHLPEKMIGKRYTRDGNFKLSSDRQLQTQAGDPVLDEQIAEQLVERAQELLDAKVYVDAKQLAVEARLIGIITLNNRTISPAAQLFVQAVREAAKPMAKLRKRA